MPSDKACVAIAKRAQSCKAEAVKAKQGRVGGSSDAATVLKAYADHPVWSRTPSDLCTDPDISVRGNDALHCWSSPNCTEYVRCFQGRDGHDLFAWKDVASTPPSTPTPLHDPGSGR